MNVAVVGKSSRAVVSCLLIVCAVVCLLTGCRGLQRKPRTELLGPRDVVPPPYIHPAPHAAPAALPDMLEPLVPLPPEPVSGDDKGDDFVLPDVVDSVLITYEVVKGDTLWDIARMYGVTHQELADCNDMATDDVLKIGAVLRIPPGGQFIPPEKRPRIRPSSPTPPSDSTPKSRASRPAGSTRTRSWTNGTASSLRSARSAP